MSNDNDRSITLTDYQQNCLAEISQLASSVAWKIRQKKEYPTAQELEQFAEIVLKYEKINWGTMYDIMHRRGANF